MQWRSIVVALVVLRLTVSCLLWLAFGLGPSWGFNFPLNLNFNLHKIELFKQDDGESAKANSWSQRLHGHGDAQCRTSCANKEDSPKKSYLSLFEGDRDEYDRRYSSFPDTLKIKMKGMAKDMFYFGYDNYMKYAFPEDELNPIDCQGRGPDVLNP